jgi:DNA-binding NtrC family response regulator
MSETILIADDTPANLRMLSDLLEPLGYNILAASSGEIALKLAARAAPDLILLDIVMPRRDGLEICRALKSAPATRDIPVLFITARTEVESLLEAFHAGGVDYMVKPFQNEEVIARVTTHLKLHRLTRELLQKNGDLTAANALLKAEIGRREKAERALETADEQLSAISTIEAERWGLAAFIGNSESITKIVQDVRRLHQFGNTSALITGESGTGKELIARAIHFGSARAKAPFIPINCVAVPAELAESMLFGHLRGSFTGATADRKGYFELAHGGTLFLDEIGDMPAVLQAKLLRVLEDGSVTPVGGAESRQVDVRIVAATNVQLAAKIAAGTFREDLYFRLARYTLEIPPLRERRADVPALAVSFLTRFATEMGMRPPKLTPAALKALLAHPFPGNVRELKNIIERALIESGGEDIQPAHLFMSRAGTASRPEPVKPQVTTTVSELPLNIEQAEALLIQRALAETGGNIAEAARILGINRSRIYRKMAQEPGA